MSEMVQFFVSKGLSELAATSLEAVCEEYHGRNDVVSIKAIHVRYGGHIVMQLEDNMCINMIWNELTGWRLYAPECN